MALSCQGLLESDRVHPPEIVLAAVDEGDRDLFAVLLEQRGVGGDVDLGPADAQFGADLLDDHPGVVAQMTARFPVQRDPAHRSARSRPLATLPVTECGRWSTTSISTGHLNRASRVSAYCLISAGSAAAPVAGTT